MSEDMHTCSASTTLGRPGGFGLVHSLLPSFATNGVVSLNIDLVVHLAEDLLRDTLYRHMSMPKNLTVVNDGREKRNQTYALLFDPMGRYIGTHNP